MTPTLRQLTGSQQVTCHADKKCRMTPFTLCVCAWVQMYAGNFGSLVHEKEASAVTVSEGVRVNADVCRKFSRLLYEKR